jgi:hypothetical protein
MTTGIAFLGGFILASAVWVLFAAVKYTEVHNELVFERKITDTLEAHIKHLEQIVHPEHWVDASDVAFHIIKKEQLYERHPELVRPGSDVIDLTEVEDAG